MCTFYCHLLINIYFDIFFLLSQKIVWDFFYQAVKPLRLLHNLRCWLFDFNKTLKQGDTAFSKVSHQIPHENSAKKLLRKSLKISLQPIPRKHSNWIRSWQNETFFPNETYYLLVCYVWVKMSGLNKQDRKNWHLTRLKFLFFFFSQINRFTKKYLDNYTYPKVIKTAAMLGILCKTKSKFYYAKTVVIFMSRVVH